MVTSLLPAATRKQQTVELRKSSTRLVRVLCEHHSPRCISHRGNVLHKTLSYRVAQTSLFHGLFALLASLYFTQMVIKHLTPHWHSPRLRRTTQHGRLSPRFSLSVYFRSLDPVCMQLFDHRQHQVFPSALCGLRPRTQHSEQSNALCTRGHSLTVPFVYILLLLGDLDRVQADHTWLTVTASRDFTNSVFLWKFFFPSHHLERRQSARVVIANCTRW